MKKLVPVLAAFAGWYMYNKNQTRVFRIRTPEIALRRATRSFRITQITDFHNHRHIDPVQVAEAVRVFSPMCIALTGDLISEDDTDFTKALQLARALVATKIPVLFVSGNHESQNPQAEKLFHALTGLGVVLLGGKSIEFPEAVVSGVDYPARANVVPHPKTADKPHIFLAHSPSDIKSVRIDADLILSGHTHGGQVRLPGIGAIIVPSEGFFAKVNKGLYEWNQNLLYIDSGIGNTRLDLRAFNPIQFTNMTIVAHR